MSGKVCLVTGTTSGLGKVTARELAQAGAMVVLIGRDAGKCAETAARLCTETGNPGVESLLADLSSQRDVRALADQFRRRYGRLNVFVNSAGAVFFRRQESLDGIEMTLALNHLAYFLLTNLLLDLLQGSAPSRVVNVSSEMHKRARVDLDDLQGRRRYNGKWPIRCPSCATCCSPTNWLDAFRAAALPSTLSAPDWSQPSSGEGGGMMSFGKRVVNALMGVSAEEGARTIVYLATSPEVECVSGRYFVGEKAMPSSAASCDRQVQEHLWRISQELAGLETG